MYGYQQPQPQFQPPPPKRMGALAITGIVIACLFGGCLTLGAIGASKSKTDAVAGSPAAAARDRSRPAEPTVPEVQLSAAQLFADYHDNEVAADERYKGRALLVNGIVSSVDKDFTDGIIVRLGTSNQFIPVDARLDSSQKSIAARLSKGASVRLLCKGGGLVVGRPQLGSCTFGS